MNPVMQEFERSEFGIWTRLLAGQDTTLRPEAAEAILALTIPADDVKRMKELVAAARERALTDAERSESEAYSRVNSLLAIMKSKARRALKRTAVARARRP